MRTNIEIDDELLRNVMKATGAKTKREAVDAALRLTQKVKGQGAALDALWGLGWEGDLEQSRLNRFEDFSWKDDAA